MTSNADARCPECGAQEPDWDARHADPYNWRAEIERLQAENNRMRMLLREAGQYVDDAGSDEDPETQKHSSELLRAIDVALGGKDE